MNDEQELNMDFGHMTIGDVEALVKKKALQVEMRNKWVCIVFEHSTVKIKKW